MVRAQSVHFAHREEPCCLCAQTVGAYKCKRSHSPFSTDLPLCVLSSHLSKRVNQPCRGTPPPRFSQPSPRQNIKDWQAIRPLIQKQSFGAAATGSAEVRLPPRQKQRIQTEICDRYGISVTVSHDPTGASKWNPVEHRLFSEISKSWAGRPLDSYQTILNYIRRNGAHGHGRLSSKEIRHWDQGDRPTHESTPNRAGRGLA